LTGNPSLPTLAASKEACRYTVRSWTWFCTI